MSQLNPLRIQISKCGSCPLSQVVRVCMRFKEYVSIVHHQLEETLVQFIVYCQAFPVVLQKLRY